MRYILLGFLICFACVISSVSSAQEAEAPTLLQSVPSVGDVPTTQTQKKAFLKPIPSKPTDPYVKSDATNLSNAYWALGVLDAESINDIDDYLIITNCDVYRDYFKNEFEWTKIREAARKHIAANKYKFPRRFEFTFLSYLDRYDLENKKFNLSDKSKIVNVKKIMMSDNNFKDTKCGRKVLLSGYPMNVMLKMPIAFTLIDIPVAENVAKEYIAYAEKNYGGLSGAYTGERKQRPVYIRFRATFEQFAGFGEDRGADSVNAIMTGSLDQIDVFADENQTINISSQKIERLDSSFSSTATEESEDKAKQH